MGHAVRDTKSLCTHCCVPASERFTKYLSGSGGWLSKWPKWTKQKEILEIRPEYRVKGQVPHLEGGDGKKENGRQILESPRGCGTHQPSEGTFPRTFQAPDMTLCINHQEPPCPTLFLPSRRNRCRGKFGEGGTGDLTTLGPSSGDQPAHWFPRGEWPTWLKPGKWHKWAMQLFIKIWHYLQYLQWLSYKYLLLKKLIPFSNLITYSGCTSKE